MLIMEIILYYLLVALVAISWMVFSFRCYFDCLEFRSR